MKTYIHNAYLDYTDQIMRVKDSSKSVAIDIFGMKHQGMIPFEGSIINLYLAYYRFKDEPEIVEIWSTSSILNGRPSDDHILTHHTEIR